MLAIYLGLIVFFLGVFLYWRKSGPLSSLPTLEEMKVIEDNLKQQEKES